MSSHQSGFEEEQEVEIEAIGVEIATQPIELYKIFKIANLVNGGGEAKHIISEGYVAVNGEIETRKRRKMVDGDLIEFNQEFYLVIYNPESAQTSGTDSGYEVAYEETLSEEVEPEEIEHEPGEPEQPKSKGRKSIQFL